MQTIECVSSTGVTQGYLSKLIEESNLIGEFKNWGELSLNVESPLLVVFEEDKVQEIIDLVKNHEAKVLIALHSRREFRFVAKLKPIFENIFGFVDLSQEIDYNTPAMMNYINLCFKNKMQAFDELGSDLDKILNFSKNELERVKELHERLVRIRVDKFEGLNVSSKFRAGEKSGGEFFDLVESNKSFLYIQAGSNNYLMTSQILAELDEMKTLKDKSDLYKTGLDFEAKLLRTAQEENVELNYCIINIDLRTLDLECRFKGEGYLYYNEELIEFGETKKSKIRPGDKIYQISNGFIKNMKNLNPRFDFEETFESMSKNEKNEVLNEFFYAVTKNKTGMFLPYDAYMSVIEIDAHKIYKI